MAREGEAPLVLAANDLRSSALTIEELYKDRWQIELFCKWIKRFCGRSENAVRIKGLTALIASLLLVLYKRGHPSDGQLCGASCAKCAPRSSSDPAWRLPLPPTAATVRIVSRTEAEALLMGNRSRTVVASMYDWGASSSQRPKAAPAR